MNDTAQKSLGTINDFLEKVGEEEKSALGSDGSTANTEPGSQGGETEHPVKNVDDRTESPADTGDRFAENTSDVKGTDIGQGAPSVDATSEAKAKVAAAKQAGNDEGSAADDQLQIGTNVQATGDDPSNETSSTKNEKEDDGYDGSSSHPARTDNNALDGHKYAKDIAGMSLEKLAEVMHEVGNDLCATIAVSADAQTKQAALEVQAASGSTHKSCEKCNKYGDMCKCDKSASDQADLAQNAGWELAGMLTGDFDKTAADKLVHSTVVDIIKTASDDAENVIEYLTHYRQTKAAMEDDTMGGAMEAESAAPEAGGEVPLEAGGGGGEDMGAALGGGMPPGAEGGMGGEPDPQAVLALLAQLGIDPKEMFAAMEQEAAGGLEGGMPPGAEGGMGGEEMAGGMPPGMEGGMPPGAEGAMPPPGAEGAMPPGMEAMAGDRGALPSNRQKNAAMRDYIVELVSRSRQKQAHAATR